MDDSDSIAPGLQSADQPPPFVYGPRPTRRRTCLGGKLLFGDGAFAEKDSFTFDCIVHDISEGGAKIILARNRPLPPDVFLIVKRRCIAYQAKIVWLNWPARGLKFLAAYPLDTVLPAELKFLQRAWVGLAPRSGYST